jgi:ubiquinone/menaquinone biosynthesis C-methylase UbiE
VDLLAATTPYRHLISTQLQLLRLQPGERVADLGAGTGTIRRFLESEPNNIVLHQLDYVIDALRIASRPSGSGAYSPNSASFVCDLNLMDGSAAQLVPVRDAIYDAVVASLLLNYVTQPQTLLVDIRRILRPHGRLVASVLRKDTDISKIYAESAAELRSGRAKLDSTDLTFEDLERSIQTFLNDAASLLDMEERGLFHFWSPEELVAAFEMAGFDVTAVRHTFGDPPQAIVICAVPRSVPSSS